MPHLLLEVGCEELPATFVRKAYTDLHDAIATALGEAFGGSFSGLALGTPRRLIVAFDDVPARQEDAIKEVRGPALKAAFDEAGNPTGALQGFCRSNGADVGQLRKDEQYVWFDKPAPGRPAGEVLAELLPKAIKGLSFEKSMRWGSARLRFARPIRWLLASLDGAVAPFEIEGVAAGLMSRGHRFYAPEEFEALSFDQLVDGLRKRKVEPDPAVREQMIRDQAAAVAGGVPDLPEALVEENVFLAEWPTAIAGEFREEHLELPEPVLTTAMAKHERMFPVRDAAGRLTRRFIFIRNSGEDETVRRGAEWVLNARLDDAQFFYREDLKHDLDYFLEKTSGIVFQEKLGTVRERADRLAELAKFVAQHTGIQGETDDEADLARQAGFFAKADLSSGLVSDMASLQGIVGGEYARRAGKDVAVCWAIAAQYDPGSLGDIDDVRKRTAARLTIADNVDKLVGYLGLGLAPTSSSDPYGLRRSAGVLVETAIAWKGIYVSYGPQIFDESLRLYQLANKPIDEQSFRAAVSPLFVARYKLMWPHVRYDLLSAGAHEGHPDVIVPVIVLLRTAVASLIFHDDRIFEVFRRPLNLLAQAHSRGETPSQIDQARLQLPNAEARLNSDEGVSLLRIRQSVHQRIDDALTAFRENGLIYDEAQKEAEFLLRPEGNIGLPAERQVAPKTQEQPACTPTALFEMLSELAAPLNAFMDSAKSLDPALNHDTRNARLTLLKMVGNTIELTAGDIARIEG